MNKRFVTKGRSFKEQINSLFKNSLFIRFFAFLSEFFYSKILYSKTAQFLTSYDTIGEKYSGSFGEKTIRKIWFKPEKRLNAKNKIQKTIENSFFYKLFLRITNYLLAVSVRVYGTVLFIYGFCAASVGVIKTFLVTFVDEDYFLVGQGAVLVVIGIFLLMSKKDMGTLLANGKITGFIIREIIGMKKENVVRRPIAESSVAPMLVGVFLGISSLFIDPLFIVAGFFAFVYVSIVFAKPEFGVLLTVAAIPFLSTMVLCAQIILVFLAYLCKLVRGKRSLSITPIDVSVGVFALFVFLGGIFSASVSTSLPAVCVLVCFMFSYFLIVNLVKTINFLKKVLIALAIGVFICSLIGIWQNFFGIADTTWTDVDMFSEIETRVVSTFENPNVFGEYLIMILPMIVAMFIVENSFNNKSFLFVSFVVGCMALVFTWSRGAWLGFLISMLLYFIVINKKSIGVYLVGLIALPFAYPFFPESIRSRIESIGNMADSSTSYRVHIWEAAWEMLQDWWLTGIGVGVGAFQRIYPSYSLSGIETAPHSHNLFFQVFLELGIFGIAAFLFVIAFAARKCCTYLRYGAQREVKFISSAAFVGLLAILMQGLTDHVWYNYRVFLMFWVVLSIVSVTVDLAAREDKRTDDVESYLIGGQDEKAEIEIQI